ncbi:MAG: cupin domain-containing protein [Pseudomonadota bacterium]
MSQPSKSPVVNIADVEADPALTDSNPERGRFQAEFAFVGRALATKNIGINLTKVPAGKTAWPRHYHYINDEMFIVIEGTGTLHYGDQEYPVRPWDVINIEAGTGIPFQIENTGTETLRYLALSTLDKADVFHYVDSDKIGIMALAAPFRQLDATAALEPFRKWVMAETDVPYWRGEPEAGDAAND